MNVQVYSTPNYLAFIIIRDRIVLNKTLESMKMRRRERKMIEKQLSSSQLKALCDVLANSDPNLGLTESEIRIKLGQCHIHAVDKGGHRNELGYVLGLNKRDWLYNCFVPASSDVRKKGS